MINIIVHYPSTEEGMNAFKERLAEAHAKAIVGYIDRIDTDYRKKQELLLAVAIKSNT